MDIRKGEELGRVGFFDLSGFFMVIFGFILQVSKRLVYLDYKRASRDAEGDHNCSRKLSQNNLFGLRKMKHYETGGFIYVHPA